MFFSAIPSHSAESKASKQELRLKGQIEKLNASLAQKQRELREEQFRRGVDTVTVVEAIEVEVVEAVEDKIIHTELDPTLTFNAMQLDSLLCEWRERESRDNFESMFETYIRLDDDVNLNPSSKDKVALARLDSLYTQRLRELASPISLPYNPIVRDYIKRYTSKSSSLMSNILTRSKYYFPAIEEQLLKHDLPIELRAMPVIESALTAKAMSHAGAAGLWQFMPSTGKMYGLEVNSLIDERCDPAKSTIAACRFLQDLYNMYDDWMLAIAAYNCGPGNVNKALARSGLKKGTFWEIYDYLPRETRGYVPAFIAATYAYAYHQNHGIEARETPLPMATDTITVKRILHLGQVAETLALAIDVLRDLNPQYRRDIIPATKHSYALRLPQQYVSHYIAREEEIHRKDSLFLKQYINPANIERLRSTPRGAIHVVRSGDTLSGIAQKYRTTTRKLMQLNNLKSAHKLSIGQKLRVSNY